MAARIDSPTSLGQAVRRARKQLKLTQPQLALTAEERDAAVADVERLRAECRGLADERDQLRAELMAVRDVTADDPQPKKKK